MRFDITLYTHVGETYPWEKIVDEAETQVKFADQAGFTTFWMAEHHFAWDGWYNSAPNPILMGTKLSRLSDRLRFGQCGVVLPDWHPLRVAEDIALMDQFTKGRVDFGIARGIDTRASIQFNLNADRRNQESNYALFSESLDVITGAWTQEAFQHEGRFYKFPVPGWIEANPMVQNPDYHAPNGELKAMGVFPKPFQKPHPPIWQMADSPGSHRFAGSRGMGVFCQSISLGKIKQAWTVHNEAMSQAQNREVPFGEKLCIVRPTYVAETYEQAIADVSWGSKQLGAWYSHNPVKPTPPWQPRMSLTPETSTSPGSTSNSSTASFASAPQTPSLSRSKISSARLTADTWPYSSTSPASPSKRPCAASPSSPKR